MDRTQRRTAVFGMMLGFMAFVMGGCGGATPVPKSFKEFTAKDQSFSCESPVGWETKTGARADNSYGWGQFTKANADIKITADATGSIQGDIARSFGGAGDSGENSAVAILHERQLDDMKEEMGGYKEKPAETIKTKMGEGRRAEFLADGSMGSKIRGYRATLMTNNRRVTVLCKCPSSEWTALKPAFARVIESLR